MMGGEFCALSEPVASTAAPIAALSRRVGTHTDNPNRASMGPACMETWRTLLLASTQE